MTRSEINAAEIVQESFLFTYQHLEEFRNEVEFGAWILGIAAELSWIQLHRVRSLGEELPLQPVNEPGNLARYRATNWSHLAEEGAMNAELRRVIQDATHRLPQGHREVFLFRDVAGLSYKQIADISGDTVLAIKRRLHQARLILREVLDAFFKDRTVAD